MNIEDPINHWHEAINSGDLVAAAAAVTNPIMVLGPEWGRTDHRSGFHRMDDPVGDTPRGQVGPSSQ